MTLAVDKVKDLAFGDLILDETCLFARQSGRTVQFTRSERALLLSFVRNPNRLLTRGRLLDELVSSEADSERNVDFLVNRLRAKLGDRAKSPKYIATQYGEGYVWIAAQSTVATPAAPITGLLAIAPDAASQGNGVNAEASMLVSRLRDLIADNVGAGQQIIIVDNWRDAARDGARHVLHVSFKAERGRVACAAILREFPSKHIVKSFRLDLDSADPASLTVEVQRVSEGVVATLRQALTQASTGLGLPLEQPLEIRLRKASTLLSSSNPKWLERGQQLRMSRERDPSDADTALQWCLHLFARLVLDSPFKGMSLDDRDALEDEIEVTVLDCLPRIEGNPLLMLAAAKLLYFINRGHLDMAEDLAERAFARTGDFAAALPVLGQLRQARGKFGEAVTLFDRGIEMADIDSEFLLHLRVLKCIALLAAGDRGALEIAARFSLDTPHCPPEIGILVALTLAPGDRPLPQVLADALRLAGADGARSALSLLYFTSARQHVMESSRANVMRSLVAEVARRFGAEAIPPFVLDSTGLTATG